MTRHLVRWMLVFLVVVLGLLIWANGSVDQSQKRVSNELPKKPHPNTPKPSPRKPFSGNVTMNIGVTVLPDHRIKVTGDTNLPNGTVLGLLVMELTCNIGQVSVLDVRDDGSFESDASRCNELNDGAHAVSVWMAPKMQSEDVREFIGHSGERLRGPLVSLKESAKSISLRHQVIIDGHEGLRRQRLRFSTSAKWCREWLNQIEEWHWKLQTADSYNKRRIADQLGAVVEDMHKQVNQNRLTGIELMVVSFSLRDLRKLCEIDSAEFNKASHDFESATSSAHEIIDDLEQHARDGIGRTAIRPQSKRFTKTISN